MKYLLLEPKVKRIAPNIALMKWAKWCDLNNHEYEYVIGEEVVDIIPDYIYMSCIFSFYSKKYIQHIQYYRKQFPKAKWVIGGPFVTSGYDWWLKIKDEIFGNSFFFEDDLILYKGIHPDISNLTPKYSIDPNNKSIVMYSSRGCTQKCKYCTVPLLEGGMNSFPSIENFLKEAIHELPDAKNVVLYDNNFTAHKYFDNIINELIEFDLPVDIHGLYVNAIDDHKAEQLAKLKWIGQSGGTAYTRFSFDQLGYRKHVDTALGLSKKHNIKAAFFAYLLYNFKDSPLDYWRRVVYSQEIVDKHNKSISLFPQRYEPLDALEQLKFIGKKWTLKWSRQRNLNYDLEWDDNQLVRGVGMMSQYIHGFLWMSPSRNIFNWIGHSYEEFINRCLKLTEPGFRDKFTKIQNRTVPSTKTLLEETSELLKKSR